MHLVPAFLGVFESQRRRFRKPIPQPLIPAIERVMDAEPDLQHLENIAEGDDWESTDLPGNGTVMGDY